MNSDATSPDPEARSPADLAAEKAAGQQPGALDVTLLAITARLEVLSTTLDSAGKRLAEVSASSRRTRHLAVGLAVSFALDVTLTVVLSIVALQAHGTANTNAQLVQELHVQQTALHAEQLASCANGNVFREDQDVIWQDFIRILTTPTASSTKSQVAAADKLAAQFLSYVTTVNHPINCTALYGK